MGNRSIFTKILAIAGTVLAWLPLVAPLLFGFVALFTRGRFMVDYLMPAEIFPVALAGGLLLLWAASRMRYRRVLIAAGLGSAILLILGTQALAVVTGLASGETEPGGWQWALVLTGLVLFTLALIVVALGGILLLRDLFRKRVIEVINGS